MFARYCALSHGAPRCAKQKPCYNRATLGKRPFGPVKWNSVAQTGTALLFAIPAQPWPGLGDAHVKSKELPVFDRGDRYLGMDRSITRRDFMNGMAIAIGAAIVPGGASGVFSPDTEPQNHRGYYPPAQTGLRGSHAGSFEIAHSLRDGTFWQNAGT